MKNAVPDSLKSDLPPNRWGKILASTPVVMAVIATLLAGLASSEMTTAQYDRSLGAQLQSKAGDQWNFFQAKRLRGVLQRNTLDLVESTADIRPFGLPASAFGPLVETSAGRQALAALRSGVLPAAPDLSVDPKIAAAEALVENSRPEAESAAALAKISDPELSGALRLAQQHALAFDAAVRPVGAVIDRMEGRPGPADDRAGRRDFIAARLRFNALRYEAEARLNQIVAGIYELQVRKANLSAERHHQRSQLFFFGMLGTQAAVIISTFAIAARQRSFLWVLATVAGLTAAGFALYVYVCF